MALIDDLRLAITRTKSFDFGRLLNGKDLSDIYLDMVKIANESTGGSNDVILTTYASFKDAMALITPLEPNRSYKMKEGIPSSYINGGIVHFTTDSIGVPKPECQILFGINVGGSGIGTGYLTGIFRVANDGTFDDSYPFAELYYPSNNIRIIKPLMNMGAGALSAFLGFCQDNTNTYQNILIEQDTTLVSGVPSACHNWTFGNAIHQFGNSVELSNGSTTDAISMTHKFPDGISVVNGVVGGAACSARTPYLVSSDSLGVLDITTLPMVKTIRAAIISTSSVLTGILSWREQEADGTEILIFPDGGCIIDMSGKGTAITNPLLIAPVTVSYWIKILIEGGDCYIIDWK